MSQQLHSSSFVEFLDLWQEQIQNHAEQILALHKGRREAFEVGSIDRKEYEKEVEKCWTKQAKLAAERTEEPDRPAAYAELVTNLYRTHELPAGWEARKPYMHSGWKQGLIEHYNAEDPEDKTFLWRPIMAKHLASEGRTAAHIVSHSIGYSNAGYPFGEPDDGSGVIWSFRNGIVMSTALETQFDKWDFVLVPVEVGENVIKYNDLDGRALEWKNGNRPARQFLCYHFVTTLLGYVRSEKPGWAEKRLALPTGKIWATQGPYLRRSMLRQLAATLGDVDELFADGGFDQKDGKPESEDSTLTQQYIGYSIT